MKILAVDYGESYIGLAKGDTNLLVAFPLAVVRSLDEIIKTIETEDIDKIVVGLPLALEGGESEQSNKTRKFAEKLAQKTDKKIEFFDERLSSKEAKHKMQEAEIYKTRDDALAASSFLQTYLEKNNA